MRDGDDESVPLDVGALPEPRSLFCSAVHFARRRSATSPGLRPGFSAPIFDNSTWLKRVVILDVMVISLGFVLRVAGGAAAIRVEVSAWLFLCTIFLALFLAFSKRRHELVLLADSPDAQRDVLHDYSAPFLDQMINVVTAGTVVAYAVYAISPETVEKFHTKDLIFTMPFVLFGIFRYLYLIYQRPSERNPPVVILGDKPFLINSLLWVAGVVWVVYRDLAVEMVRRWTG